MEKQDPKPAPSLTKGGPQGDKAPSEDPAGPPGSDNKTELKGKKVDADPSKQVDKPVKE